MADIESDQLNFIEIEDPTTDSLDNFVESARLWGDDGDPDSGALPRIMMIDFGRRKLHAAPEVVEYWAEAPTFLFEGGATGKPEVEFESGGVHSR